MLAYFTKPEFLLLLYFAILFPAILWGNKLPSVDSLSRFAQLLNSRGGNIFMLGGFTLLFFIAATRYIYVSLGYFHPGTVMNDETIQQMGMTFFTSTAFSSCFGALLKTMTGEDVQIHTEKKPDDTKSPQ